MGRKRNAKRARPQQSNAKLKKIQAQLHNEKETLWDKRLSWIGWSLMIFALLSFIAEHYFDEPLTDTPKQQFELPRKGGVAGPFKVMQDDATIKFHVRQLGVPLGKWYAVDVEVLDDKKQYMFGFGDEFWHESGHDSDGSWQQAHERMAMHAHFEKAGEYYLKLSYETNDKKRNIMGYRLWVTHVVGSSILFDWLTIISFWLGLFVLLIRYREHLGEG